MQRTELTLILLAAIALLLTLVVVVLLVQMKQRRQRLRLRDRVIAEETAKIEALTDELRRKGINPKPPESGGRGSEQTTIENNKP